MLEELLTYYLLTTYLRGGANKSLNRPTFRPHRTIYTECPGECADFGRMFLKLKYTDITKNTYIRI